MMEARFLTKVNKIDGGCWEWTGKCDKDGYGRICVDYKTTRTHRVAYELWKGEIPDGLFVLHSCDNPKCVNPIHLRVGSHEDNMNDRLVRHKYNKKLTEQQIHEIRAIADMSHRTIAKMYNVSHNMIGAIIRRDFWKHI